MPARPPDIFDPALVKLRREKSSAGFGEFDFLHRRVMADIVNRLESVNRTFPLALFYGAGGLVSMLSSDAGVSMPINSDCATGRLAQLSASFAANLEQLPIAEECLDLFCSVLTLHTANDLIGALTQARLSLKPDGLFLAAMFGENTLGNLKASLYHAEAELTGGVSPRVAPFATVQDAGVALMRAGFALPVIDVDKVRVEYRQPAQLLCDIRGMGEASPLKSRSKCLRRDVLNRTLEIFGDQFGYEQFEIIYLTGWAPHESQQQPLKRGSGKHSLADAIRNSA